MTQVATAAIAGSAALLQKALPASFLNCYEIVGASDLAWPVSIYVIKPTDGDAPVHSERGKIRDVIWEIRKRHRRLCRGYGFVIDVDEQSVAVPQAWELPTPISLKGYDVELDHSFLLASLVFALIGGAGPAILPAGKWLFVGLSTKSLRFESGPKLLRNQWTRIARRGK